MSSFKRRKIAVSVLAALAVCAGMLRAGSLVVPNGSFESPGTDFVDPRIDSWQKTPKPFWYDESGDHPWDVLTGVFANTAPGSSDHIDNCDGNQAVFLTALPQAGFFQDYNSIYGTNTTPSHAFNARFEAGNSYRLTVGVIGGGGNMLKGVTLEASLYYRDGSNNVVPVAATTITNTPDVFLNTTHLVDFHVDVPVVKAGDVWAGQNIGVMLVSTVSGDLIGGYWDLDNVRLSSMTEGAVTLASERSGSNLKVSWLSETGRQYQAQTSGDLASWTPYDSPLTGDGSVLFKLVPTTGGTNTFFRVLSAPGQ